MEGTGCLRHGTSTFAPSPASAFDKHDSTYQNVRMRFMEVPPAEKAVRPLSV